MREAIVAAGEDFGLRQVGGRAYSSNTLESGWIPSPLPAVYSGDSLKAYREWLPADGLRGLGVARRQLRLAEIEDYYFTPWDLGYGSYVKFDHDFIGREALERMAGGEHRQKVTLALDDEDVTETIGTMFQRSGRAKFIDWPSAVYSMHPFDRVTVDGETVGVSTWIGYSANEGKMLTLAVLDPEHAEPGTEVTFVWGEEGGGTTKPTVEPHEQTEMRAVVSPVPYVEAVRKTYAPGGWRAVGRTSAPGCRDSGLDRRPHRCADQPKSCIRSGEMVRDVRRAIEGLARPRSSTAIHARALRLGACAAIGASGCIGFLVGAAPAAIPQNPIQAENARPGTAGWLRADAPSTVIAGYSLTTSVAPGDRLRLAVSAAPGTRYRVEVYRLGWYGGVGARLVACHPSCKGSEAGIAQPNVVADWAQGGIADEHWQVTDVVPVVRSWTSGYYFAELVAVGGTASGRVAAHPVESCRRASRRRDGDTRS